MRQPEVRKGNNALELGIGAVSARLGNGTQRVVAGSCPNLLAEAGLYRYGDAAAARGEASLDDHNHALAALRYLVSRLDHHRMARTVSRTEATPAEPQAPTPPQPPSSPAPKPMSAQRRHLWDNPDCWTRIF